VLDSLFWKVFTLREHVWHRRDLGAKLSAIRQGLGEEEGDNWGAATDGIFRTGPASTLPVSRDIESQLRWLEAQRPAYLMTHPSNLAALARHCIDHDIHMPYLREARTRGEALAADLRELCREAWGIPVVDMYSSNECGYIALQCPETDHYHVMAEGLLVEVIDDEGHACAPGQTGRIVVSTLHNFAMPLIRYEIGDLAEVGAPCACGRGLPVLARILGRERNMFVLANGKRFWPSFGLRGLSRELGIRQHQLVQKSFELIEARLVVDAPLDAAQEARLRRHLLSFVPEGFRAEFSYCTEIPRSASGKFILELSASDHHCVHVFVEEVDTRRKMGHCPVHIWQISPGKIPHQVFPQARLIDASNMLLMVRARHSHRHGQFSVSYLQFDNWSKFFVSFKRRVVEKNMN
jgi:phenylacetate-CoA ligase